MTCALINPRKDLARVAKQMHRALKTARCRCIWAWGKNGYAPITQCPTCAAIESYEAVAEALP